MRNPSRDPWPLFIPHSVLMAKSMVMRCSSGENELLMRPSMYGPGHRSTAVRRSFVFCSPLFHPTSGTRTSRLHRASQSFVAHFALCSTQKNASNARRIHKTIVRLVRRSSCSSQYEQFAALSLPRYRSRLNPRDNFLCRFRQNMLLNLLIT